MQVAARRPAVLARGKDDKIRAGIERPRRECPFTRLIGVVRQIPPEQADWACRRVVNLDPVLMLAIFVREGIRIAGKKLGENELCPQGEGQCEEQCEEPKGNHTWGMPTDRE